MAATYEPIATTTLSTATASINFSSIPQTYTDLRLVVNVLASTGGTDLLIRFNNNSGFVYYNNLIYGAGSGTGSAAVVSTSYGTEGQVTYGGIVNASLLTSCNVDILSYRSGIDPLSFSNVSNAQQNYVQLISQGINSTAAITTITLFISGSNNLAAGTSATLYGIKAA